MRADGADAVLAVAALAGVCTVPLTPTAQRAGGSAGGALVFDSVFLRRKKKPEANIFWGDVDLRLFWNCCRKTYRAD